MTAILDKDAARFGSRRMRSPACGGLTSVGLQFFDNQINALQWHLFSAYKRLGDHSPGRRDRIAAGKRL
jgi:hypothetical protein